ncbi:MAG: hypothetical protein JWN44_890 [Myxococcales bacterium]|nr:hypothetical protein [Myxococcales bacterium]
MVAKLARGVKPFTTVTYGGMRWFQTFYVHWIVPVDTLTPRIPRGTTVDLWRGHAVVSMVAIDVEGPAPRALLQTPMAHLFRYRQLNLRTYVDGPEGPGMTLLETRIDRPTYALAARLAGMPYHLDRQLVYEVRSASLALRARGIDVEALVSDAAPSTLMPGTLEYFACERYRAYAQLPVGRTLCVQIAHAPWRARPLALQSPLSPAALGLPVDVPPASAQLCEDVEVVVEHLAIPADTADEPLLAPA